jgi:hypothetical protein
MTNRRPPLFLFIALTALIAYMSRDRGPLDEDFISHACAEEVKALFTRPPAR